MSFSRKSSPCASPRVMGEPAPLESFHFGVLVGLGFIGFRVSGFGLRV